MARATLSASVTSLVKTIVGAGILGIPLASAQTGSLLGAALLLAAGGAQLLALHLLSLLVLESTDASPSFRSLALQAFGSELGASTVELIMAGHCFGTATSYLIVVGDLCPQLALYVSSHVQGCCWAWAF